MGLFSRKQENNVPQGHNEIENKKLKEAIATTALRFLEQGTDYHELAYTKAEFGYLFDFEGHGIEARSGKDPEGKDQIKERSGALTRRGSRVGCLPT